MHERLLSSDLDSDSLSEHPIVVDEFACEGSAAEKALILTLEIKTTHRYTKFIEDYPRFIRNTNPLPPACQAATDAHPLRALIQSIQFLPDVLVGVRVVLAAGCEAHAALLALVRCHSQQAPPQIFT